MEEPREIIPRTRSVLAASGAFITSAGVVVLATGIVVDARLPWFGQLATLTVGALFALAMLTIALRLLSSRGGLLVDAGRKRVGIGVTSERDTWWLPVSEVVGIRVVPEARVGETIERWLAVLELVGRSGVVLARSDDRGVAILVARKLATAAGLEDLDELPGDLAAADSAADQEAAEPAASGEAVAATARDEAPESAAAEDGAEPAAKVGVVVVAPYPVAARHDFAVRRRAALQGILFFFGVSLTVVGAAMFARVEHDPVFGFLFGPLLGLLGIALLGVSVVKRFATEELWRDGEHFVHGFRLGRLRWGHRRIHARAPRWHLYVHGLRGAHLELVGSDGTLVIGGGATTRSDIDLDALARLPRHFAAAGGVDAQTAA